MPTAQVALMLHRSKNKLVQAKFRPKIRSRGRITNRISCAKQRAERDVGNISYDECKKPCSFAAKIEEDGVWCNYG